MLRHCCSRLGRRAFSIAGPRARNLLVLTISVIHRSAPAPSDQRWRLSSSQRTGTHSAVEAFRAMRFINLWWWWSWSSHMILLNLITSRELRRPSHVTVAVQDVSAARCTSVPLSSPVPRRQDQWWADLDLSYERWSLAHQWGQPPTSAPGPSPGWSLASATSNTDEYVRHVKDWWTTKVAKIKMQWNNRPISTLSWGFTFHSIQNRSFSRRYS